MPLEDNRDRYGHFITRYEDPVPFHLRTGKGKRDYISAGCFSLAVIGFLAILVTMGVFISAAHGHDMEHPELDQWYQGLMQPDNPTSSCCGEADAYWADEIHYRGGKVFAVITDDREVPHRPHIDVGTEIEVPNHKLKWDRGNPTGHGIIFLSRGLYVYCYVQPGGV